MKIGLGTYALAWSIGVPGHPPENPMDIYQFLDFAHESGFNLVQVADNLPLHQFNQQELNKILEKSNSLGIEVEVGTRGMTPENIKRYLDIAQLFRSPILRTVIDVMGFEPSLDEIHRIVRELIPDLEASNIKLAIENHDRLRSSEFLKIIQNADSEYVGICLDTVNSIGADEGFETVFSCLGPHTINLHLKDYTIKRKSHMMGFDIEGAPAGKGRIPINEILKNLEVHGKCQSMILELWPPPEKELEKTILKEQEWVRKSAHYLFENYK
jgi:sugar phosphate isomerase/epimerase